MHSYWKTYLLKNLISNYVTIAAFLNLEASDMYRNKSDFPSYAQTKKLK